MCQIVLRQSHVDQIALLLFTASQSFPKAKMSSLGPFHPGSG
jgi:hypothetical protein